MRTSLIHRRTHAYAIESSQKGIAADLIVRNTRAFGTGNSVVNRREARFVRGPHGRQRIDFADQIFITDPTTSKSYSLDQQTRTFWEGELSGSTSELTLGDDALNNPIPAMSRSAEVKGLGSRIVNGVECNGQQISNEVPAGAVGNQESFRVEAEIWKTSEFGEPLTVLMIVRNPLSGVARHELQNIRSFV